MKERTFRFSYRDRGGEHAAMTTDLPSSARVVVCGAGIIGVSVAFHLTRMGVTDVVVIDERPPLTLTSDKSTECYRNWWPTQSMVDLMQRSIDLIETYSADPEASFNLQPRGYLYVTGEPETLSALRDDARRIADLGTGPVRTVADPSGGPDPSHTDGADLYTTGEALRDAFGYLAEQAVGGIHVRRAGWLSAQQLGAWMIDRATEAGVVFAQGTVSLVDHDEASVSGVRLVDGRRVRTNAFVNAAGPLIADVGRLVGVDVPVYSEIHRKVTFKDHRVAIPRDAPLVIWNDPQRIGWGEELVSMLTESGYRGATETLLPFVHGRPEGGDGSQWALGLWEWTTRTTDHPSFPLPDDPLFPELVIRGLSAVIPAFTEYFDALPLHSVDGGYYTKTVENLPLVGPIGPPGSFVCGAVSGYGIMAACAVGELAALHVSGGDLPSYASALDVRRYRDKRYVASLRSLGSSGQI